jgi:hypothetical protein
MQWRLSEARLEGMLPWRTQILMSLVVMVEIEYLIEMVASFWSSWEELEDAMTL